VWMPAVGIHVTAVDVVFMPVLGFFLWTAASASIRYGTFRGNIPDLQARLLARRTLTVPADLPLAEAIRRAQEDGAGSIVALDSSGHPQGIVVEEAVLRVPDDRRPWTPVGVLARSLEPGLMVPADLSGDRLIMAMQRTPATEYLLVEPDGSIFGVLSTADVDRAFTART
jgi:CBS domain-containing protein